MGKVLRAAGRFIKRHRKPFVFLLIVAVVGGGVYAVLGSRMTTAGAVTAAPETTTLAKMDLEQTVTATGTLQSTNSATVSSSLSYEIASVDVQVGDTVTAGQQLATLDGSELEKEIASLRKSIGETKASESLALTQAERKLQDAQNDRSINEANNSAGKQAALEALNDAKSAVTQAEKALEKAKTAAAKRKEELKAVKPEGYTDAEGAPDEAAYQAAQAQAQAAADAAAQAYEEAQKTLTAAQEAQQKAQEAYDNAVANQESQYRNDSINIENAQDSVNNQKVGNTGGSAGTATSDEDQLEQALEDQQDLIITAPIGGTVTAVNAEVGDTPGGSAAADSTSGSTAGSGLFVIQNTDKLEVEATVAEYDMVNIREGMAARVTSDALDDVTWNATVTAISPVATDDSGNFTVTVEISSDAGQLRVGMTTTVEIILDARSDVYAVPYDAVTTNAAGESVVYVWEADAADAAPADMSENLPESLPEGMPETMPAMDGNSMPAMGQRPGGTAAGSGTRRELVVETGLETDYYIEITGAELHEGMLVINDPLGSYTGTDSASNAGDEGGMFSMGGGMMGGGGDPGGGMGGGPPA